MWIRAHLVHLDEEQRVWLRIEAAGDETPQVWLERARARQAAMIERQGLLPDSTLDIAEDRKR